MAENIKIALLEDHPVFRMGLKTALSADYQIVLEAGTGTAFLEQIDANPADLIILDLILPDVSGIDVARQLKAANPDVKILVFSIDMREETMQQLVEMEVEGFISKRSDLSQLKEAIDTLLSGQRYYVRPERVLERDVLIAQEPRVDELLTARERAIMMAFCQGSSTKEIAKQFYISPFTVENHKRHIFAKLGIHNVVELVNYAIRNRIITLG